MEKNEDIGSRVQSSEKTLGDKVKNLFRDYWDLAVAGGAGVFAGTQKTGEIADVGLYSITTAIMVGATIGGAYLEKKEKVYFLRMLRNIAAYMGLLGLFYKPDIVDYSPGSFAEKSQIAANEAMRFTGGTASAGAVVCEYFRRRRKYKNK